MDELIRCGWCGVDPLYVAYHDREWGVPLYDDQALFEFLLLESMQAGLSWYTILKKRENLRRAFAGFDPEVIARFDENTINELLLDSSIIRNRLKVEAAVTNARAFLKLQEMAGSFASYQWSFVDGKPLVNHWNRLEEIPAHSVLSDRFSKELKKLGFRFVGSTICYSHLQATGVIMDHLTSCFRHDDLLGLA